MRISSVQFSHSVMSNSLWSHGLQHARPPYPSQLPEFTQTHVNRWCHPTISSSVIPFSFCLQSFPESGSFQMKSALCFRWSKYWSFSFTISPSNVHSGLISFRMDWWIFLQSEGLSRVFSNTTVQKHQFFGAQLPLQSNSHIHTWPLEKP